jgi:hypothetical protein
MINLKNDMVKNIQKPNDLKKNSSDFGLEKARSLQLTLGRMLYDDSIFPLG